MFIIFRDNRVVHSECLSVDRKAYSLDRNSVPVSGQQRDTGTPLLHSLV